MSNCKHKSIFQGNAVSGLSVYECGWEKCGKAETAAAAAAYPHYIIRFIVSGAGEYRVKGREYKLSAGELFFIPPETSVSCRADVADPWVYFWTGFGGPEAERALEAAGFDGSRYTLKVSDPAGVERAMRGISQYSERSEAGRYGMTGWLYLLFSELVSGAEKPVQKKRGENYVSIAKEYIDSRFAEDIGIDGIAFHIGVERSYFYKVFKETMGVSPQEYLIDVRMSRAQALLKEGYKNLKEIAAECGYTNYSNFSKMFKKKSGLSPKAFQRKIRLAK